MEELKRGPLLSSDSNSSATVGGASPDAALPAGIPNDMRVKALLHAYEESIRLSRTLAVTVVYFDFLAQIAGKTYQVHDWLIGLILSPFGGAIYEFLTGKIAQWVRAKQQASLQGTIAKT